MDSLDMRIIDILRHDGRVSNAKIARAVAVSEGTVRRRLKRLIDDNLVEVRVILNLGRKARTVVGIHADPQSVDDILDKVSLIDGVTYACITAGRYDLMVWLEAENANSLGLIISRGISSIQGVQRAETHVVLSHGIGQVPA